MPNFWVKCPHCGEYKVGKEIFFELLTDKVKVVVQDDLNLGAQGAVIKYKSSCYKCAKTPSSTGEVSVLWPAGYTRRN